MANTIADKASADFLQGLSSVNQSTEKVQSDQDQFMELMIAQLKNQNPLEPEKNGDFLSQLAQFNTVDGIDQLNESVNGLSQSFQSSHALQATTMVGKTVQIDSEIIAKEQGKTAKGSVELDGAAEDVKISISHLNGDVIKEMSLGRQSAGDVPFEWDGLDQQGQALPEGIYQIASFIKRGEQTIQATTKVDTNVNSVTLGQGSEVSLNTSSFGAVPLSTVKNIK